jgi:hypothetical protein
MSNFKKYIIGFVVFITLFFVGYILQEKYGFLGPNKTSDENKYAYLDQEWKAFYSLDHLYEEEGFDKELYFYKTLEYDDGISVSYKTSYIAPVVDNVMLLDDKLMFEGWIKNPETQEWTLITFHVMGKYTMEDLQFLEGSVPLEISTKSYTYNEDEVLMSDSVDIDSMMVKLSESVHEQVGVEFYYDIDLQNYLDTYEIDSEPIIVDLLLSDNYNKLKVSDYTSPKILDESEIYVTSLEFLNQHHK